MKIKRTANAGVLIELDGTTVLLDGVCDELSPYLGTPDDIRHELGTDFPDVVAFTHRHKDHYDEAYAKDYETKTLRSILGPECPALSNAGNISLNAVVTRHIGKADVMHVSFVITGSKCIWFMGDASPLELRKLENQPKPDVLIAPYAYASTPSAWRKTRATGAEKIIILHMPKHDNDPFELWSSVEATMQGEDCVCIPEIGQTVIFN